MKFHTELELVNVLKASLLKQYNKKDNIEILEEVSVGFGVADVVITLLMNTSCIIRPMINDKLDYSDINVYDIISKYESGIDLNKIVDVTKSNKRKVISSLHKLISFGYVFDEIGIYSVSNKYSFPFRTNIAIEAKLKDWKRALKQAYRYKWFAEYSVVVLDEHYSKKAIENIAVFKKYNVGLATISLDGAMIKHYFPVLETPYDLKMKMLFSEKFMSHQLLAR